MAIHTLKTPLRTVSKPDFSPQLGLAYRERAIWSNQSMRLFTGLAAIASRHVSDGRAILFGSDLDVSNKLIKKHSTSDLICAINERHYYATTALVELTIQARKQAAVQLNDMAWLVDDNPMAFEILATVGRAFVSIDCAGVFSHHQAEVNLGHPIAEPQMQFADLWYKRAGGVVAYARK